MLQPIYTEHTNMNLGAPRNWDGKNGTCISLPVYHDDGAFHSWWKLTWRERLKIMLGSPVRLTVLGEVHPPVALNIGDE